MEKEIFLHVPREKRIQERAKGVGKMSVTLVVVILLIVITSNVYQMRSGLMRALTEMGLYDEQEEPDRNTPTGPKSPPQRNATRQPPSRPLTKKPPVLTHPPFNCTQRKVDSGLDLRVKICQSPQLDAPIVSIIVQGSPLIVYADNVPLALGDWLRKCTLFDLKSCPLQRKCRKCHNKLGCPLFSVLDSTTYMCFSKSRNFNHLMISGVPLSSDETNVVIELVLTHVK